MPFAVLATAEAAPRPGSAVTEAGGVGAAARVGASASASSGSTFRRSYRPPVQQQVRRTFTTPVPVVSDVHLLPDRQLISPRDCETGSADCPSERAHPVGWPSSRVTILAAATGCQDSRRTPYLYLVHADVQQGEVSGTSRPQGTFSGGTYGECVPSPFGGNRVGGTPTAGASNGTFVPGPAQVTVYVYRVPRDVVPPWTAEQQVLVARSQPQDVVLRSP
jgi:hypothetical protein